MTIDFEEFKDRLIRIFNPTVLQLPSLSSNSFHFLKSHFEYFIFLKDSIRRAKSRIILTSLYIGNSSLEGELIDILHENLRHNSALKVDILLDKWRNTRRDSTMIEKLKGIEAEFPQQLCIRLYSPPSSDTLLVSLLPERIRELFGVMHCKFYAFDDTLLLSGANLSESYFTTRIDRYLVLSNVNELIEQCFQKMICLIDDKQFNKHTLNQSTLYESMDGECFVFPAFQLKHHRNSIDEDERLFKTLLELPWSKTPVLASAYFNLPTYPARVGLKVIVPSNSMHGFHGSRGLSQFIPALYRGILGNSNGLSLYQYHSPNSDSTSCFHAKGFWAQGRDFQLTMIGSSNYNQRGYWRDFEFQLLIATRNNQMLGEKIENDLQRICKHAIPVNSTSSWMHKTLALILKKFL